MTREKKLIFREWHQKTPTYGQVRKLVLESEFQQKGNKQMKKMRILSKILRFSWQEQIQIIKLFKDYTEKYNNKIWPQLSLLGQEPTFKTIIILQSP